ncbi:hypothetical protein BH24ACT20_BH24ACT20_17470 [soil metagenome]
MKLIVFGSTGSVGRRLVELGLVQGHEVAAFVRSPAKLDVEHESLEVVQGDVMDLVSVVEGRARSGGDSVLAGGGQEGYGSGGGDSEHYSRHGEGGCTAFDLPNDTRSR